MHDESHQATELAARRSYGRLVAHLAHRWRDLAAAEDALGQAFATALERWPREGVPASPEAWLLTTARRNLLQGARHTRVVDAAQRHLIEREEELRAVEPAALPDHRLQLMLVCAHPAIDPALHSALILQSVLGIDAARIASAFLVSPEAMTKRLGRAKTKLRANGIRFELPGPDELVPRLTAVLEAIYGAYTLSGSVALAEPGAELAAEAMVLAELVVALAPDQPEALGLLAILSLCEARRSAQYDAQGRFVPLDRQDTERWDRVRILDAGRLLARAAALSSPGPLQLEAAIQAAHAQRAFTGVTPWAEIEQLYRHLTPTIGARVGHAVARAEATGDPAAALAMLDAIPAESVVRYQPWWVARGYVLGRLGRAAEAAAATERAIGLTENPAVRAFLIERLAEAAAGKADSPGSE
jgi:RNA polymerase sigma-70 factor (ECF subfamily)